MLRAHHIGYLVSKLERAKAGFLALGYVVEADTVYDPIRKVDICFLQKDGYRVELVSPKSADSVVAELIKRYKNAPYHICYESDDFSKDVAFLAANGYHQIAEPCTAPALAGKDVVFFLHPAAGMIELIHT